MLQRIDSESASRGLTRWLRNAGLAGIAIITLASGTIAGDSTGRARMIPQTAESPIEVSGRARLVADSSRSPTSVSGHARLPQNRWTRTKTQAADKPAMELRRLAPTELPLENLFPSVNTVMTPSVRTVVYANSAIESSVDHTTVDATPQIVSDNGDVPIGATSAIPSADDDMAIGAASPIDAVPGLVPPVPATQTLLLPLPLTAVPPEKSVPALPASEAPPAGAAPAAVAANDLPARDVTVSDIPTGTVPANEPQFIDAAPQTGQGSATANSGKRVDAAGHEAANSLNYSNGIHKSFQASHHRKVEDFIRGSEVGPMYSVGEWWHEYSERYIQKSRHVVLAAQVTIEEFVVDHTLPENPVPAVDFYDSHPIALSAPSVQPRIPEQTSEDTSELTGTDRLKTDIRTIKPTLTYALKGIKRDQLPDDFDEKIDSGEYVARQTSPTVLQWAPTNLWHYPLYFEDPALERYGHTYHPLIQPFASTGRFATQLVGLPYQMTLHPVCSREYALGYYRPGECAPKKCYQIPFNEEATLMEVAVITGLILIFP